MSVPKEKFLTPDPSQLKLLFDTGFDLIPLYQWDAISSANKHDGKRPLRRDWRNLPALTIAEATAHMAEGCNIGIRIPPGIVVIDDDPRNYKDGDKPLDRIAEQFGIDLSATATTITGSGGRHIFFRLPDDLAEQIAKGEARVVNQLDGIQGVEFKGYGRQVVAPGSVHPIVRQHYTLDDATLDRRKVHIADASPELVAAIVQSQTKSVVQYGFQAVTPDQLGKTLDQLNPTDFRDHDKWLEFMMACHAATQGEGLDEFIAWSTSDPEYVHCSSVIAYRWDSLDANKLGGISYRTFLKTVDEHGGRVSTAAADFAEVDADEDADHIAPERSALEKLNDTYCTAMEAGKFWVFTYEYDEALERRMLTRIQPQHFKQHFANQRIEDGKRSVKLGDAWIEWSGRRSYDSVQFLPERTPNEYVTPTGHRILNLWSGFNVEPKPGDWPLLDQLIREALTRSDAEYEYLLNWFAYSVQHPELPAGVATVFRGKKGTGKSTLGKVFCKLFGNHSLHIASRELLTGRFNLHLRDCVALFADEAFFAGDKDGESRLKGLITERVLAFEGKNLNALTGRNTLSVMMATNHDWAVPATADERRYVVFDVDPKFKGDTEFFNALNAELDNGGIAAFLASLLDRDTTEFHPERDAPKTSALADQIRESIDDAHTLVIMEMIESGRVNDFVEAQVQEDGHLHVSKQCLQKLAERVARTRKWMHLSKSTNAAKKILEEILEGNMYGYRLRSVRPRVFGGRRCYELPPLEIMRELWATYLGCNENDLDIDTDVTRWCGEAQDEDSAARHDNDWLGGGSTGSDRLP